MAEGLEEHEGSLLAKEVIETIQRLLETIVTEWDTVTSPSEDIFFKRWSRLVLLSDVPDPVDLILNTRSTPDEFDFEIIVEKLSAGSRLKTRKTLVRRLPWQYMTPDQIVRLFHQFHDYHELFAANVSLTGFNADRAH